MEVRIKPMVIRVPETTRETTYIERTFVQEPQRDTEPLPVMTPSTSAPETKVVVITQPERMQPYEPPVRQQGPANDDPRPAPTTRTFDPTPDVSPVVAPPVQEQKAAPSPASEVKEPERKSLTPDNKNVNEPITFSQPEPAPRAKARPKMKHQARDRGRQRKFHHTIALLKEYHDGSNTDQFERLDPQMQRYYRREYDEYFGRESAAKANQRLANRTKAARTQRDAERREIAKISRGIQGIPDHGSEELDIQRAGA
jgi:hypothetical protein